MEEHILTVRDLCVEFQTRDGVARVINSLGFELAAGETLGIVGESGCGKTMTALTVMGLVPSPPGRVANGSVLLGSEDLLCAGEERMSSVRGREISMIFQEPMTSLNPVFSVGQQISETLRRHENLNKRDAWNRAVELIRLVGIHPPERRIKEYPFQMSGGMRQRVMIAIALACNPQVLIADEPTTALDVTIQAQILDLLRELQRRTGTAIILITHDVGVIAETTNRVIIMYAGCKVEEGPTDRVIHSPRHPYTHGLIACVPVLKTDPKEDRSFLTEIPGVVPPLTALGSGCPFQPRCRLAMEVCAERMPPLEAVEAGHQVACWSVMAGEVVEVYGLRSDGEAVGES